MTAVVERPTAPRSWNSMPGWGIVGDLTPPELIEARRLRSLRRLIVAALVAVVVLCAAGYAYALLQRSHATDDLDNATTQTTELQHSMRQYTGITRIQEAVSAIRGQVAGAMTTDVDVARLLAAVRTALPTTMSIDNLTVTLSSSTGSDASTTTSSSSASLNTSGRPEIGTVLMTGSAQRLDDVAAYVDKLAAMRGVADVVPTSNQVTATVTTFNISLALTDAIYSHYFDVSGKGVK